MAGALIVDGAVVDGWSLVLALARVGPAVLVAPAAGGLPLPRVGQVAIALAVAAVVAAGLSGDAAVVAAAGWPARVVVLVREVVIGTALGAVAAVPLVAAAAAGGWASAAVSDDVSGGGTWTTAMTLVAATVFFAVGGHLAVVDAVGLSYRALPVGSAAGGAALATVVDAGAAMLAAVVTLAAPMLATALVAALACGAIERLAGTGGVMVPEGAVRRAAVALVVAASVFAVALAVAGQTRALPAALERAVTALAG